MEKSVSAPAWWAEPSQTGTALSSVATPSVTCPAAPSSNTSVARRSVGGRGTRCAKTQNAVTCGVRAAARRAIIAVVRGRVGGSCHRLLRWIGNQLLVAQKLATAATMMMASNKSSIPEHPSNSWIDCVPRRSTQGLKTQRAPWLTAVSVDKARMR
eukprot:6027898-Pleurochrysis_carterae.AAC.2